MITGGYLKDVPLPHKRRWPGEKRQREVHAQIARYVGAMGRHYYASIQEERNPIWDTSDAFGRPGVAGWVCCWDDEGCKGKQLFTEKFDTHVQAMGWVKRMMTEHFPDHELIVDDYSGEYYQREGD